MLFSHEGTRSFEIVALIGAPKPLYTGCMEPARRIGKHARNFRKKPNGKPTRRISWIPDQLPSTAICSYHHHDDPASTTTLLWTCLWILLFRIPVWTTNSSVCSPSNIWWGWSRRLFSRRGEHKNCSIVANMGSIFWVSTVFCLLCGFAEILWGCGRRAGRGPSPCWPCNPRPSGGRPTGPPTSNRKLSIVSRYGRSHILVTDWLSKGESYIGYRCALYLQRAPLVCLPQTICSKFIDQLNKT